MKSIPKIMGLSMAVAILTFGACKKENDQLADVDTQSAADNYMAEQHFNDELKQVDDAATNSNLGKTGPTITIDSSASPRVMTIDYGTGMVCADGKTRSGKILVSWTGRYRETGTQITITTDNFYQNGNKLEGTKQVINRGRNTQGNLNFDVTVNNGKVTTVDGKVRTWNAVRNREWIAGENTLTPLDDKYRITGSASGTNANGLSYSANIIQALVFDLSCQYRLTQGEVELLPQGKLKRTINYGNGACDGTFSVKIGNKTITVTR